MNIRETRAALCALALLAFCAAAFAETHGNVVGDDGIVPLKGERVVTDAPITLERARALAFASSKTLSSLGLSVEGASLDERLHRYESLPSLSLSATASASAPPTSGLSVSDTVAAGVSLGATQTLYSGGKNAILSRINSLSTAIAREKAREGYYAVLDAVDDAWFSLLEAYATKDSAEAAIRANEASLEIAKARREIGAASAADCLEAEANAASARTALWQAARDVSVYSAKLASLTGLERASDVERTDFSSYDTLVARLCSLGDDGIASIAGRVRDRAIASNPSLASQKIGLERAGRSVELSRAGYLPTLSASVATGLDYTALNKLADPAVRFSLSGKVPLDAWVTAASTEKSRVAERQAALGLDEGERSLAVDAATAAYGSAAAARAIASSVKAVEYAEANYENKLELYRLGAASVTDLAGAASLAAANRGSLIKARYAFLRSLSTIRTLGAFGSDAEVLEAMGGGTGAE